MLWEISNGLSNKIGATYKKLKNILIFTTSIFATAILLRLSFTQHLPGTIVFFAFIPIIYSSHKWGQKKILIAYFLTGIVFYGILLNWIKTQSLFGYYILVIYCSLYLSVFGFLTGKNAKNIISIRKKIALSIIFSLLEYIKNNLYIGFPWGVFASALHKETILLQTADTFGIYGISFFIILINLFISSTLLYSQRKDINYLKKLRYTYIHFSIVFFIFSFLLIYGENKIISYRTKKTIPLTIGIIQPNIDSYTKWDYSKKNQTIYIYKKLSMYLNNTDIIIWPESVVPGELIYDSKLFSSVMEVIGQKKTSIVLGSGNMVLKNNKNKHKKIFYNSAYFITKNKKINGIYNKMILVPFGEYIPFKKQFPKLKALTPIKESFTPGSNYTVFTLKKQKKEIKFSAVICIEDIYPNHIRNFVKNGADFLINITNDGWFKNTSCAYQHYSLSVLRAVENNRYLIRCANTGISCVISPLGETITKISKNGLVSDIRGILKTTIYIPEKRTMTIYTKYGDLFIIIGVIYLVLYLGQNKIYSILRNFKRRKIQNIAPRP